MKKIFIIILSILLIVSNIAGVGAVSEFTRFMIGSQNKEAGLYDVFIAVEAGKSVTDLTDSRLLPLQNKFSATTEESRKIPLTRGEFLRMVIESSNCSECKNYNQEAALLDAGKNTTHYWKYIGFAYNKKIISGYPDGTFRPDSPISRAEATKILVGALGITPSKSKRFTDVGHTGALGEYIQAAFEKRLINGTSPTTFNPDATISRGELIKILYNIQLGIDNARLTSGPNATNNNQNMTNNPTQNNTNDSDIKYGLKFVRHYAENFVNDFSFTKGVVGNIELQAHGNDVKIREITFVIPGINSCDQMPIIYSAISRRLADNEFYTLQDGYVYSCLNGAVTWKFMNPLVIQNGQKKNFPIELQVRGTYEAYDLGEQTSVGRSVRYKKQYVNMPTGTYQIIARNIQTDKGNIENIPFGPKISYKDPSIQVIRAGSPGNSNNSTRSDDCSQWLSEVARLQGYANSNNLSSSISGKCLNGMSNSNDHYVNGYYRSDGTYVSGHRRTNPDNYEYNNYSNNFYR